jgi:SAM-dependent methyltransferase
MSNNPPVFLNLGCGYKTSDLPGVVNIDWSPYVRLAKSRVLTFAAWPLLGEWQRTRLLNLSKSVRAVDLRKGIPWADNSVDAVYHSHTLEHIDREAAPGFLAECRRVLRPGGVLRIAVPDLEYWTRRYIASLESDSSYGEHEEMIDKVIGQSVRRESFSSALKPQPVRKLEGIFLGDARKRGETHQWMYDRKNLRGLLLSVGFSTADRCLWSESRIPNWNEYGLEVDEEGHEYKAHSLYFEAVK